MTCSNLSETCCWQQFLNEDILFTNTMIRLSCNTWYFVSALFWLNIVIMDFANYHLKVRLCYTIDLSSLFLVFFLRYFYNYIIKTGICQMETGPENYYCFYMLKCSTICMLRTLCSHNKKQQWFDTKCSNLPHVWLSFWVVHSKKLNISISWNTVSLWTRLIESNKSHFMISHSWY